MSEYKTRSSISKNQYYSVSWSIESSGPPGVFNRLNSCSSVWVYTTSTSCCRLQGSEHLPPPTHTHKQPLTYTLFPSGSNTEQYWQLGSQPKVGGCDSKEGGRKKKKKDDRSGGELGAPAAACSVGSCEGVRQPWREEGQRGRESLAGSPALSFTPNQALVWAWNAFVFQNIIIASSDSSRGNPSSLIRHREGRKKEGEGRNRGAQEATRQGWKECWRSNRLLSHLID